MMMMDPTDEASPATVTERLALARVLARLGLRGRSDGELAIAAALREIADVLLSGERRELAERVRDCARTLEATGAMP